MVSELKVPLPWQRENWQRLSGSVERDRTAHALLMSGPQGLGKQLFAAAFCQTMLCQYPSVEGACGECKNCQLFAAGNHPDYRVITLEDKAQSIKIDQIRELVVALAKTPQIGARHWVIIDPADALNNNAANALLKLLEEPSGDAIIVLISAYPHRLPATVRSRCQQLNFAIPASADASAWLQNHIPSQTEIYLSLAKGAPLRALQLHWEAGLESHQEIAQQLEGVLLRKLSVVDAAAVYAARSGTEVVDTMLDWIHQMAGRRLAKTESNSSLIPVLEQLGQTGNMLALFRFYDKLSAIKGLLISAANPNRTLLWEECLLDWLALANTSSKSTSGEINLPN